MTPRKIFLFGLCVITIIFLVSAVLPNEWKVGTLTFRYPDYRTWFKSDTIIYKNIQEVLASVDTTDYQIDQTRLPSKNDTIPINNDSIYLTPDSARVEIFTDTYPFEYPQEQDTLLFPFFRTISRLHRRNQPVRILHYGDSQIEADRITATIRNYMQKNYGGQGVGFLPIVPVADVAKTFQQDVSPKWKRFSVSNKNNLTNQCFGISGNLARYIPSNECDSMAHIGLRPIYVGNPNIRKFTNVRLLYGPSQKPFTIVVNQENTQLMTNCHTVSSAWWQFETEQNSLDLSLVSSNLPDLYGITLDGDRGVAVDNFPLRGSCGLEFTSMDTAQMGQIFRMIDVKMLILQFGCNLVPNVVSNYDYYATRFTRQLQTLKSLNPELVIVVVGVSDVSKNGPNGLVSYPNIVKIRDAQKKAAFDTGCVFWDLYEAMGGENSMPSWVSANPPLAQKDFVHFTVRGAKIVAELFCKAWSNEYQRFISL